MDDNEKARILRRIEWIQNTRDYAAPEYAKQLTAELERLLDTIEPRAKQMRFDIAP